MVGAKGQNRFAKQVPKTGSVPIGRRGKTNSRDGLQDLAPVFLGQQGAAAQGPCSSERIRVNWLLTKLCM